jgi:predicted enzyme related to lactoylglutathione lyase
VATARESGGRIEAEPMDIPNIGRFAVITDPQGATFAIIKTYDMS